MGQLVEDILDGSCCQLCGCYFQHPKLDEIYCHGYPVVCWDCWESLSKNERQGYIRAEVTTF